MDKILELKNVKKLYGKDLIFDNINLQIEKGDVISIIGKSGSGKSTLLKCLNKLENIDGGQVLIYDTDINDMPITLLRQKVGIVFQEFSLFEHLTVLENLTIGLNKIKKYDTISSEKKAKDVLKKIGLVDKINNYPDELSGGQKQRVAIARTLLMKPDIILLDEPTSALDKETKIEVIKLIKELVRDKMTLIIVSHEEKFVNCISNKIFKLENGHLVIQKEMNI